MTTAVVPMLEVVITVGGVLAVFFGFTSASCGSGTTDDQRGPLRMAEEAIRTSSRRATFAWIE